MINKFKLILSKIRIAQQNKKKILKLNVFNSDLLILNVLWKKGLIYGYNKTKDGYVVFLKYSLRGLGLLNSLVFLNTKLTKKELKTLLILDSNFSYLVLTYKGVYIYSLANNIKYGGKLIAKF